MMFKKTKVKNLILPGRITYPTHMNRTIASFLLHSLGGFASAGAGLATWTTAKVLSKQMFDHRLRLWEALLLYGLGSLSMFSWTFLRKRDCEFQGENGKTWTESVRLIHLNSEFLQERQVEQINVPFWRGYLNFIISQN